MSQAPRPPRHGKAEAGPQPARFGPPGRRRVHDLRAHELRGDTCTGYLRIRRLKTFPDKAPVLQMACARVFS